jgi:hypothetical protein
MSKPKAVKAGGKFADWFLQEPMQDHRNGRWFWAFNGWTNSDAEGTEQAAKERYSTTRRVLVREINAAIRRAVKPVPITKPRRKK